MLHNKTYLLFYSFFYYCKNNNNDKSNPIDHEIHPNTKHLHDFHKNCSTEKNDIQEKDLIQLLINKIVENIKKINSDEKNKENRTEKSLHEIKKLGSLLGGKLKSSYEKFYILLCVKKEKNAPSFFNYLDFGKEGFAYSFYIQNRYINLNCNNDNLEIEIKHDLRYIYKDRLNLLKRDVKFFLGENVEEELKKLDKANIYDSSIELYFSLILNIKNEKGNYKVTSIEKIFSYGKENDKHETISSINYSN